MDEKEFDEKFDKYLQESKSEIEDKYNEKLKEIKSNAKKTSDNLKEKYANKESYNTSLMLIDYMNSADSNLMDMLTFADHTNNEINKRVLKKFFVNK